MKFFCASSIVIFGGTGDLATRKLIPALCRLSAAEFLDDDFHILVTGRKDLTTQDFLSKFISRQQKRLKQDSNFEKGYLNLKDKFIYVQADPDRSGEQKRFLSKIRKYESSAAPAKLFYLAVPPYKMPDFIPLVKPFSEANKGTNCPVRILVEKPFGSDLESAKELNNLLLQSFSEDQILRIDHYLGKEAVQNILFMRFANTFFEPVWNNLYIENVQISFSEKIGIGTRGSFFDNTGILRDVVQNHLLQVLTMVAMEPPLTSKPSDLHLEKTKVLEAIKKYKPEEVPLETVRARYVSGKVAGKSVPAYLEENGVAKESNSETFAACRLFINNWRWAGVPFYLRAGKRLEKSMTEICITFKQLPHSIFTELTEKIVENRLFIRVQPDEGITLQLNSKPPGMKMGVTDVALKFSYEEEFGSYRPDAYERLLLDALKADSALFINNSEIEAAWKFIDPIINSWKSSDAQPMCEYAAGTQGPKEACELLAKNGHEWLFSEGEECK